MKSGLPRTEVISLEAGYPDGNIAYTLSTGTSDVVTPQPGAVSVNVFIPAIENTLPGSELFGYRDLTWSYLTGGVSVSGSSRWTLEGSIPFGATAEGARSKLGLDIAADLPDEQVPLLKGYYRIQTAIGETALAALESGSSYQRLLISDAIEASAALILLPTMQVRLAKTETSGTNSYTRQNIDWELLAGQLQSFVAEALSVVTSATTTSQSLFSVTAAVSLFPDG